MDILTFFVAGYAFFLGIMFFTQRSLMYFPSGDRPSLVSGYQDVEVATADGLVLRHWFRPPARTGMPVVMVFHGNAGDIGDRVPKFESLLHSGFGLFLAEYRGYGGNPGRPTQEGLVADGRSALAWLKEQGIEPDRIVLYGESLGSGVAISLAAEQPVGGLILEAPFSSLADVSQHHYWYLPARWLILDKWASIDLIGQVTAPLLVIHGERDTIIPIRFGRRLYEAAEGSKDLLVIPDGGHNDLPIFPEVGRGIAAFLERLVLDDAP